VESLHLTLFDIIALLLLSVSTLVGFVRGALREVSTVVAFVIAVAVAIFALPLTGHVARAAVQPSWAANTAAVLVVFLAVYILVRVLAAALTRGVHSTQTLGTVDRIVGAGFGVIRGLVLLGLFNLVFSLAPPPSGVPAWVSTAKLFPLATDCTRTLLALAPKGSALAGKITPVLAHAVAGSSSEPAASSAIGQTEDKGYSHAARKGLDDAVEKSR
jgi:membrane protein required for colicin V production